MRKITLKTLKKFTGQQIFDFVAKHLLEQNRKSMLQGNCKYRGADGLECAAGCLIGDDEYTEEMENKGWFALTANKVVPKDHCRLICDLQTVHDGYYPEEWRMHLRQLALDHGLLFNQ